MKKHSYFYGFNDGVSYASGKSQKKKKIKIGGRLYEPPYIKNVPLKDIQGVGKHTLRRRHHHNIQKYVKK